MSGRGGAIVGGILSTVSNVAFFYGVQFFFLEKHNGVVLLQAYMLMYAMVVQTRKAQLCYTSSFLLYLKIEKHNGVVLLQAYMLMYAMVVQTRKAQPCCTSSGLYEHVC